VHGKCAQTAMQKLELSDLDGFSPEGYAFFKELRAAFEKGDTKNFSELMGLLSEAICSRKLSVGEGFSILKFLRLRKEAEVIDLAKETQDEVQAVILSADLDLLANFRDELLLEFGQEILAYCKKKMVS